MSMNSTKRISALASYDAGNNMKPPVEKGGIQASPERVLIVRDQIVKLQKAIGDNEYWFEELAKRLQCVMDQRCGEETDPDSPSPILNVEIGQSIHELVERVDRIVDRTRIVLDRLEV